ncbi:hypothetical protein LCGC14_0967670 [marine sediment metagenome]|uniref:Uncharacterized protein n=1 Tax=marine sediment metagenome TaxID=412755 RepID=A0A0F9QVX7_9ZZZZ
MVIIKTVKYKKANGYSEEGLKEYEYLLHHIVVDDKGVEDVHHCLVYDHIANMFEQAHLVVKDGKVTLEGKTIKDGTFHVLKGIEPLQEVSWSDEEADENKIKAKKMRSGMTFKEKSKEW